jgi:hypothetical protein
MAICPDYETQILMKLELAKKRVVDREAKLVEVAAAQTRLPEQAEVRVRRVFWRRVFGK